MPPTNSAQDEDTTSPQTSFSRQTSRVRNFFSVPAPVKTLFNSVPILTYPPNELPQRAPKSTRIPILYVFSTKEDAAAGRPSFNPSCLKWQAFLNIVGINHRLASSNNHASPTGSLPFLLPASTSSNASPDGVKPITSNKLIKYAKDHGAVIEEPTNMRHEAYQSLLDHRIRSAWLYTLYLEPKNFSSVAYPLYISSISSNPLVRASISYQLRAAAEAELLKHSSIIDTDDLYSEADKAFEALSILLGNDPWFFGHEKPTLFDASIFAYTQLLLDENMEWKERKLCRALRRRENLVQHRERLLVRYFGGP
ncbi:putative mitochondrial outer membrane protein [Tricladium varicosporioides]|nr:putative mitochondrial outer membrane protein [Hymenoscyphus varicosporioides]